MRPRWFYQADGGTMRLSHGQERGPPRRLASLMSAPVLGRWSSCPLAVAPSPGAPSPPVPTAPSENAQSLSVGQPPFNRQLRPTKAPGVPTGNHGGGGRMRMWRSSIDQAGAPDNRTRASQPGGNTRRQGQTAVFDS